MGKLAKIRKLSKSVEKYRDLIKSDHSDLLGIKVKPTKEYSSWLKSHIDEIHSVGKAVIKDESYEQDIFLFTERPVGKIIKVNQCSDCLDISVEFKFKKKKFKTIFAASDVEESKD